jgi:RNA polymerase sigma factor (sigma-70 family)
MPDGWDDIFRRVYLDLAGPLIAFVTARLHGRADLNAEDVCQEIWMRFHAKGREAAREGRARPWLFAVARNLVIDLRALHRAMPMEEEHSIEDHGLRAFDSDDPAHLAGERERQGREERLLGTCLERLEAAKPAHGALIRFLLSGVALTDIARRLQLERDRCHKIKFEAIQALRGCVAGGES